MLKKKKNKKILFTGGHAGTTTLSILDEIKAQKKNWELHFIGVKKAIEGKSVETLEYKILSEQEVHFHSLVTGRIQKKFTRYSIFSFLKIFLGIFHAFTLVNRIKPDVVVSVGGFASFPVVINAYLRRVPIIIHEQTSAVGLANKMASVSAAQILISRESSKKYFPEKKTKLVGNPIRGDYAKLPVKEKITGTPTILITGGSRGSQPINRMIKKILPDLLQKYKVIHLTGQLDFEDFKKYSASNYVVYDFVDLKDMVNFFKESDVVIARSGANTVSELIALCKPAILIPIPWTRYDEQNLNAKFAKKLGLAEIIDQDADSSEKLLKMIEKQINNFSEIVKEVKKQKFDLDRTAPKKIVDEISCFVE